MSYSAGSWAAGVASQFVDKLISLGQEHQHQTDTEPDSGAKGIRIKLMIRRSSRKYRNYLEIQALFQGEFDSR